ncbi:hypothetical protein FKM82_028246 [Ascaphus truei]
MSTDCESEGENIINNRRDHRETQRDKLFRKGGLKLGNNKDFLGEGSSTAFQGANYAPMKDRDPSSERKKRGRNEENGEEVPKKHLKKSKR